jgi:hypothetical protein
LAFGIEHAGEFQFGIESTEIAECSLDISSNLKVSVIDHLFFGLALYDSVSYRTEDSASPHHAGVHPAIDSSDYEDALCGHFIPLRKVGTD